MPYDPSVWSMPSSASDDYNEQRLIQEYFAVYIEPKLKELLASLLEHPECREIHSALEYLFTNAHSYENVESFQGDAQRYLTEHTCEMLALLYYLSTGNLRDDDLIIRSLKTISDMSLEELYLLVATEMQEHLNVFFQKQMSSLSIKCSR